MRKQDYFILLPLILVGCQRVVVPDIEGSESFLVIDGYYSTQKCIHQIGITYSKSFAERPYFRGATVKSVYVEDDQGRIIPYHKVNNFGLYQTDSIILKSAEMGHAYTLIIEDNQGDIYRSLPQIVVPASPVDSIYWEISQQPVIIDNSNESKQEMMVEGVSIYVDSRGINKSNDYFFYQWNAFEQHIIIDRNSNPSNFYTYRRLKQDYNNAFLTANTTAMNEGIIRRVCLMFIPKYVIEDYREAYSTSEGTDITYLFEGMLFGIQQYSLSNNAYNFWHKSQEQLLASGKLFDPVASQINSNITCITDPEKQVFGVFTAGDVTFKYYFLYYNSANKIYCNEIDTFPEIQLGVTSVMPPDGWIYPH